MTSEEFFGTAGVAALVAAVVTAFVNYFGALHIMRYRYRLAERKKLQDLMGRYIGRMLEAAVDWDHRMETLYERNFWWVAMSPGLKTPSNDSNEQSASPDYRRDPEQYLYLSVVFRFLRLLAIARRFEAQAFYINTREARKQQPQFLCYAKSFIWVMTDSTLSPDDQIPGIDHFPNEEIRPLLDLCYRDYGGKQSKSKAPQGEPIFDWRRFLTLLADEDSEDKREIDKVLKFFEDLRPIEYTSNEESGTDFVPEGHKRRRWERLVCLDLLAINFIMTFGYSWQKQNVAENRERALHFLSRDKVATDAFRAGLDSLGLDRRREMKRLRSDLDKLRKDPAYGFLPDSHKVYACTNKVEDYSPCRDWARRRLDAPQGTEVPLTSYCPLLQASRPNAQELAQDPS